MAQGKLKIDIRRSRILELLREQGSIQVSELSRLLDATPVTIRNDLSALERDGNLIRVQGGALLPPAASGSWSAETAVSCLAEKQRISLAAAAMIPDGSTLFLNSGTTTQCFATVLKDRRRLNVVTTSLSAAMELGKSSLTHTLLLGGEINAQYGFTYGGDAEEQLRRYQADWAVLSVDGVSAAGGVTSFHAEETSIDRMMIAQARNLLILADYTKIGRAGFSQICACGPAVHLVTDQKCSPSAAAELRAMGVTVTIV